MQSTIAKFAFLKSGAYEFKFLYVIIGTYWLSKATRDEITPPEPTRSNWSARECS